MADNTLLFVCFNSDCFLFLILLFLFLLLLSNEDMILALAGQFKQLFFILIIVIIILGKLGFICAGVYVHPGSSFYLPPQYHGRSREELSSTVPCTHGKSLVPPRPRSFGLPNHSQSRSNGLWSSQDWSFWSSVGLRG